MASPELIKAVAVTAELMGTSLSPDAAKVFCADLESYDEQAVMAALQRCRHEVRGRLTLADVVTRVDDGRPGPEEAWAQIPKSEQETVVWCQEASEAFGVALPMIESGDMVAARMAFREAYTRRVAESRAGKVPTKWLVSLGHDKQGREAPIQQAVQLGRLTAEMAKRFLPEAGASQKRLGSQPVRALLGKLRTEIVDE